MVAVLLLSAMSALQYNCLNRLAANQDSLTAENQQLLSWGVGTSKVASLLQDVAQIDTTKYKITLLSNTVEYRTDFSVTEEVIKYSLTSSQSNLDVDFRFRNNHFSRYQLTMIESSPIFLQTQPSDLFEIAKGTLDRYKDLFRRHIPRRNERTYLAQVNQTQNTAVTAGQHETPNCPVRRYHRVPLDVH